LACLTSDLKNWLTVSKSINSAKFDIGSHHAQTQCLGKILGPASSWRRRAARGEELWSGCKWKSVKGSCPGPQLLRNKI
jgi:hypothetical protein